MRTLLLIITFAALLAPSAAASADEPLAALTGVAELQAAGEELLPEDAGVLDGFAPDEALLSLLGGLDKTSILSGALKSAAALLLIALGCGVAKSALGAEGGSFDALTLAGVAAIALVAAGSQKSLLHLAEASIIKLQDFANVLLPVLATASAASGQVSAAAAKYAAAALFLNVLVNLVANVLLPLIWLFFAAAVGEAASDNGVMRGAAGLLKWLTTSVLTCVMLAFTLFISLSAITTGAADAALVRSAKTLVSTALPVVGGIAADAASAILASAGVISKSVGVYGLVAVLAVSVAPFLRIGAHYLVFKAAASLGAGFADGRLAKLTSRCAEALGLSLGCLGGCCLMLYFTIFVFIGVNAI